MPCDLYYMSISPPCCSVLLVARSLGLSLNLKTIDLIKGEHMTPEFIKINHQHSVPTLDDGGFVIWESHAIMGYLVDQYGKSDALYPRDAKKRALVNQRMFFDSGTLFQRLYDFYGPVMFARQAPDPAKAAKVEEALGTLDKFLEGQLWVTGGEKTIADYCLAVTVANVEVMGFKLDPPKLPNLSAWFSRTKKEMPGYQELVGDAAKEFGVLFKTGIVKK